MGRTLSESVPWWEPRRKPQRGAPNVVIVLLDDLGYSDVGCYGSEIDTPSIDAVAARGVRFSNFHATPICSPTRASLLTGLNSHAAGVGSVQCVDSGFPGYRGVLHEQAVTAAEVFQANGYATMTVGKWHLSERRDLWAGAPRASWPLQRGFDRYYGFLEYGLTNVFHPNLLVEDNHVVPVDRYPDDYYFTDDITDRAIDMIRSVKVGEPDKPFFLYLAHAAVHAPLMAKPDDMAKYRGRFDRGWDALREERFARQKAMGLVATDAVLPPRNRETGLAVEEWESLPERQRELYARHMEVYAGMVDNVDQNLGRLLGAIDELGELDNTVVMFLSDNGASRDGGPNGTTEYFRTLRERDADPADQLERDLSRIDLIGSPQLMCQYPLGWAMLGNTPFRMYKISSFAGGHQVPFIVSWPAGIEERQAIRHQYVHVTDVLPTLIDVIGLEPVTERDGKPVKPMAGTTFGPALRDADAPTTHTEQYYESVGNRSYYRDGWEALVLSRRAANGTWQLDDDHWRLFDLTTDPTQTVDLSEEHPGRLKELREAFESAAAENDVYPLLASTVSVGGPESDPPSRPITIPRSAHTLERTLATNLIIERSFSIAVDLAFEPGDQGVLVAHGDQGTGYVVYVEGDELTFLYNRFAAVATFPLGTLPAGAARIELAFDAPGGGVWHIDATVDGTPCADRFTVKMPPFWFTPFEGIDVGIDRRSPVSWDLYQRFGPFPYTGTLHRVTYAPGPFAPDATLLKQLHARDTAAARG